MHKKDTVLYVKIGRAERVVASFTVDAPDVELHIAAAKQRVISECLAAGSDTPLFRVELGNLADTAPV